ncbi:protein KINESIN LIGHT CHAIN-RELATED 1-like [Nymphaea colorata]|nr:protein KINESIN LIGHT CHAIN-RELATED 1-like [Nymphaea colorata]
MPGLVLPEDPPAAAPPPPAPSSTHGDGDGELEGAKQDRKQQQVRPSTPKRSPIPRRSLSPSSATPRRKSSPRDSGGRKTSPSPEPTSAVNDVALDNPDLGPFLLKLARDLAADNPRKALDYAVRAAKSFELTSSGSDVPNLDLVMCLHVAAAINSVLGRYDDAVEALERSVQIPVPDLGPKNALAAFSGYMQLGDTLAMLGRTDRSLDSYVHALRIQKQALGETDPRVAETCRYIAEAYVQAMRFPEAEELCRQALAVHRERDAGSLEEAADRRLMALICDARGDYESALENLVLAGMAFSSEGGRESDIAGIDRSIGDTYFSLGRYDEAVFAYQKALTVFKSSVGDNHPAVAAIYVRLAHLYHRTGKLRESKSYCESALRIYTSKQVQFEDCEELASGLAEVSAVYEAMSEHEEALKVLQKAAKLLDGGPGQRSTVAGLEAQMGVMNYILGRSGEAYECFKGAVEKLREGGGEQRSVLFGMVLNQMGLVCIQLFAIEEAAKLFEEAKGILEKECGPCHPDTLGVCSNLAAAYDAMGRVEDAIEILEFVLGVREEKLGTADPDVDDEKRRLTELLKEAGKARNRKAKSLENLIDSKSQRSKKEGTKRWPSFGFRS